MIVIFSCEEYPFVTNCEECLADEPPEINLVVKIKAYIRINNIPSTVTIRIYEGNLEDGIMVNEFYTVQEKYEIPVYPNKKYTVTATYSDPDGNTYIAVDSALPRIRYEPNMCEDPCYWIYDRIVNLRLKYN